MSRKRLSEQQPAEPARCPSCGKPMTYVQTIWRAFQPNLEIWDCRSCQKIVRQVATEAKR